MPRNYARPPADATIDVVLPDKTNNATVIAEVGQLQITTELTHTVAGWFGTDG